MISNINLQVPTESHLIADNISNVGSNARTGKSRNFQKCIHVNGQSIRHKMDLLEAETSGYDVIAVSETWLRDEDKQESTQSERTEMKTGEEEWHYM